MEEREVRERPKVVGVQGRGGVETGVTRDTGTGLTRGGGL